MHNEKLASDEQYLRRAIDLAMTRRGCVEPNPMVGCVIVKNDRIIGQGAHTHFGGPHAEPAALDSCTESREGATAYVTLEPCCHTNKKTPPCVPRLIAAKIARVVMGAVDPNPDVDGKGIRMLREAGIQVDISVLAEECRQLLAPFIALTVHKRPYITLKWAQSADGKVAGPGGKRTQISNERSSRAVHELRARCDAILVGINTVLRDDPMLTARGVNSARTLTRYVLDRSLRTPLDSQLVRTATDGALVIATNPSMLDAPGAGLLRNAGAALCPADSLADVFRIMGERNAAHVLVEPGPTLCGSLLAENLCDRLWVIRSPKEIGDGLAAAEVPPEFVRTGAVELDGDVLSEYLNPTSAVYFANQPSADFRLIR